MAATSRAFSKSDTPCKTMHALIVEKMGEKIKSKYVNFSNQRATQRSMLTLHCDASRRTRRFAGAL